MYISPIAQGEEDAGQGHLKWPQLKYHKADTSSCLYVPVPRPFSPEKPNYLRQQDALPSCYK